ncbi:DUF4214 domain-containing protein [Massilia sp. CCM 8733]|uniref:DUF4214 domain-containing protein n=1 Tax=Massilia mucilaginosa TaxID=2609282 RepID=A0ABX0NST2_9BURK|nr:DUF4214 domain-containing protein [Massilia mucilaginosa]NHZ89831.1 DUF4214 domain-containing protein [Massilia mucilaginosa]
MAYPTIDYLPSLTAQQLALAHPLVLDKPSGLSPGSGWDLSVDANTNSAYAALDDLYSFTMIENATYDIFSHSFFDPYMITLYDQAGRVIAIDKESDSGYGMDYLSNFVAPYSGKAYVEAGWHQGSAAVHLSAALSIYADLDTIPKPTNTMIGNDGVDIFMATKSSDLVDGAGGVDTMVYTGKRGDYDIVKSGAELKIYSLVSNDGVDSLRNVEKLRFSDSVSDIRHSDLAQALYVSYFGRAADTGGLKGFQARLSELNAPSSAAELSARYNTDASVKGLIDSFGSSAESNALYSGDNKAFVRAIYSNLLGREPDQGGLDFWTGAINTGALTRANASLSIMAGAQGNSSTQGKLDALLIGNKISVASNFTYGLETEGKTGAYNGLGAAAVSRDLLKQVTANTDAFTFQTQVIKAVASLPTSAGGLSPIGDAPPHADAPLILLSGVDSQPPSLLYA